MFLRLIFICSMGVLCSCAPEPLSLESPNQLDSLAEIPIFPTDNVSTESKIELGKKLFWDPILSGNKDVACVTCHHPDNAYAEMLDLSIGVGGRGLSEERFGGLLVKRNSFTILNTAHNPTFFWDNRANSLEEQALLPILSAEEMRGNAFEEKDALDSIVNRLNKIPEYRRLFDVAFRDSIVNADNMAKAIASFERSLISSNSPFDRFNNGEEDAMTSLEKRGMLAFVKAGCAECHGGPMFSDFKLHVLTVPENPKLNEIDRGDGGFAFRTPSLRNSGLTAPYMHNGVFKTLEDVLEFYDDVDENSQNRHIPNSKRDELLEKLNLEDDEEDAIIAFLHALSDEDFDKEILLKVPSGLAPGGAINK